MALNTAGTRLYALLEGPLKTETNKQKLLISEFDLASKAYTGRQLNYKLDSAANAIGDMTAISDHEYMVVERDNNQGAAARFKKIFVVDTLLVARPSVRLGEAAVSLANLFHPGTVR